VCFCLSISYSLSHVSGPRISAPADSVTTVSEQFRLTPEVPVLGRLFAMLARPEAGIYREADSPDANNRDQGDPNSRGNRSLIVGADLRLPIRSPRILAQCLPRRLHSVNGLDSNCAPTGQGNDQGSLRISHRGHRTKGGTSMTKDTIARGTV